MRRFLWSGGLAVLAALGLVGAFSTSDPAVLSAAPAADDKENVKVWGIPFRVGEGLKVKFSVQEATSSYAVMEACTEYHFIGETYNQGLGSLKLPAPFGYLAELESMKDNAKQDLMKKLIDQIFGIFTKEQMGKINQLYDLIQKLQ